jgi:hypothetical protein
MMKESFKRPNVTSVWREMLGDAQSPSDKRRKLVFIGGVESLMNNCIFTCFSRRRCVRVLGEVVSSELRVESC